MFTDEKIEEIMNLLLELNDNTKLYLGCDSVRVFRKGEQMARYATVLIVHMNGNKGCRIFSEISYEKDYDQKPNRPKLRMMNEVMKVCQLYNQLAGIIDGHHVEVHMDINTNPQHGSSCAAKEAAGYVLGMTGLSEKHVKFKPESWASSFGADGVVHGRGNQRDFNDTLI